MFYELNFLTLTLIVFFIVLIGWIVNFPKLRKDRIMKSLDYPIRKFHIIKVNQTDKIDGNKYFDSKIEKKDGKHVITVTYLDETTQDIKFNKQYEAKLYHKQIKYLISEIKKEVYSYNQLLRR